MTLDPLVRDLYQTPQAADEQQLAARYAPLLCFDANEPFLPLAAGYTIFRTDQPSPSFNRPITLQAADRPPANLVIEYAIWWDWDIGHLYELEHVWVYVDAGGRVIHCEASAHGGFSAMVVDGQPPRQGDRVVLYSEPGKHAFAATPAWPAEVHRPHPRATTRELAGVGGLLVNDLFRGRIHARNPLTNTLVRTYLHTQGFVPSWTFPKQFSFAPEQLMPWPALYEWIPRRIDWWVAELQRTIPPADYRFVSVGHRGASAHAPDNTLAGIRKAAALGADMVEVDVQCTADGEVVLVHDHALRTAKGDWLLVSHSTLAELQAVDLGGGERVPTLAEAIACCKEARLGLYIELKDGRTIPTVLELLHTNRRTESSIIGSFRPDWLADVKLHSPQVATSVLFGAPTVDPVTLARSVAADYVHPCWERRSARPDQLLTPAWVEAVRAANLGIVCWHEERPEVIAGLRTVGVDAICSDRPELLRGPGS